MKKLSTNEIRSKWLEFFESKGHKIISSSSLVPKNDPSLLWINSGVATLKPYFSGEKIPPVNRLTNSQLSLRTNDIENVGVTSRHHTLFEMLGNFSIGDYFKSEALEFAYEFIFDILEFNKSLVYITYYDEDKETYDKWISLGVDPSHLIKGTRETNFWDIGKGPCGPDTEMFFDRGSKYSDLDPIKAIGEDIENDRYVEFWNIVFSQFNNDGSGNYVELKQKNIDTGAGLERLASIMQETDTNYETDNFQEIMDHIDGNNIVSKRIIADHMRAAVFTVNDGVKPSNNGRGYIVRRLIRRAAFKAYIMNSKNITNIINIVDIIAKQFQGFIEINAEVVKAAIKKEILSFENNIQKGLDKINQMISEKKKFNAEIVFKLFETYGYPMELTNDTLAQHGLKIDLSNMDELRKKHAERSKGKTTNGMNSQIQVIQQVKSKLTDFVGYNELKIKSKVIYSLEEDGNWYTLVEKTPFYAKSGGQQSDQGDIDGKLIKDVIKDKYGNIWHVTDFEVKGMVELVVDKITRQQAENNHSATHLLQSALRKIYGNSVKQLGSNNSFEKLRFDFPLDHKPTDKEIDRIEAEVISYINKDSVCSYTETTIEKAIEMGALAMENEDYGTNVRVVQIAPSIELCGGTHVESTSQIKDFAITKLSSIGSGVFRIEAITSHVASNYKEKELINNKAIFKELKDKLAKLNFKEVESPITIKDFKDSITSLKKKLKQLSKVKHEDVDTDIMFKDIDGVPTYINLNFESSNLKAAAATLREAHPSKVIIIGNFDNDKHSIAVASNKYNSNKILMSILDKHNGRGGGTDKFAMGSVPEEIKAI